ncbi:MAG: hypothetical protein WBO00_02910 [Steroidobacteraceae bacterium]
MNPFKLIGWAAIAISVVSAFTTFEYMVAILVVLGLVGGVAIAGEDHVRVLVTALVLTGLSGVLMNIPGIGEYLAKIFSSAGAFVTGATFTIISRNVWNRYKP